MDKVFGYVLKDFQKENSIGGQTPPVYGRKFEPSHLIVKI